MSMDKPVIDIKGLQVFRQRKQILNVDKLLIHSGELVSLVGPNGAGKSTLLKVINMVDVFDKGKVVLFGQDVECIDKLSLCRRCAMVFQDVILLNDTVYNNVALGLKFRGINKKEIKTKVEQTLSLFQCSHLVNRSVHGLSGGEAQRVSLARALVYQPDLLLMDEPFASLDSLARSSLLSELRHIAIQSSMTVILVSHNYSDVLSFADRAIVMSKGRVLQDDKPEVIMRRPASIEAANLVCIDNIIECYVKIRKGIAFVHINEEVYFKESGLSAGRVTCCLPGDALYIVDEKTTINSNAVVFNCQVVRVIPEIGMYRAKVGIEGIELTMRVSGYKAKRLNIGMTIQAFFYPEDAQLIPVESKHG